MRRLIPALVAAVLVLLPVEPARADDLQDKQAEAARISRELEAAGRRVSVLAEEYNAARLESERLQRRMAETESELDQTDAHVRRLRTRLKGQAVESYVRGGAAPALAMLVETDLEDDIAVRHQYVTAVTNRVGETLDELRAVRMTLEEQADQLDRERRSAKAALAAVEASKDEARTAQRVQEQLLAKVRGEVAQLVAAEEQRKAEAEARRVRAELAERRAREEAAAREAASRRAAPTTTAAPARTTAPSSPTTRPPSSPTTTAPPPATAAPPPSKGADAAVAEAKRQLGKPYQWGGSGPDSFDCSGLTAWAWRAGGKSLPHSSRSQYSATSRVAITDLQPGDLVFYGNPIHHVGIYVGDGQMIEAPETGKNVRYASIYRRDLVGAGRVN